MCAWRLCSGRAGDLGVILAVGFLMDGESYDASRNRAPAGKLVRLVQIHSLTESSGERFRGAELRFSIYVAHGYYY